VTFDQKRDIVGVDWKALSFPIPRRWATTLQDGLKRTWASSWATVLAYEGERLVGVARVLSDGARETLIVCAAVLREYQRRGIGTAMMPDLIES